MADVNECMNAPDRSDRSRCSLNDPEWLTGRPPIDAWQSGDEMEEYYNTKAFQNTFTIAFIGVWKTGFDNEMLIIWLISRNVTHFHYFSLERTGPLTSSWAIGPNTLQNMCVLFIDRINETTITVFIL